MPDKKVASAVSLLIGRMLSQMICCLNFNIIYMCTNLHKRKVTSWWLNKYSCMVQVHIGIDDQMLWVELKICYGHKC